MTYATLLMRFLAIPVAGMICLVVRDWWLGKRARGVMWPGWSPYGLLLALMVVAILYTTPWDHHLIAIGVWWYRPSLVSGVTLGRIPLEEVIFFPVQTAFIGLWCLWLIPRLAGQGRAAAAGASADGRAESVSRSAGDGKFLRLILVVASGCLWLTALTLLFSGWRTGTYLRWEFVWALPPIMLQLGVGGDILWRYRFLLVVALVPTVLYLSVVDALAISAGIWTIDPHQSLGILIGGRLPLEEFIFFTLTSVVVAFGLVLGTANAFHERLYASRLLHPLFRRSTVFSGAWPQHQPPS